MQYSKNHDINHPLVDTHGRRMKKLRVSLTDACNFQCFYCRPEDAKFIPWKKLLSSDKIFEISKNLVALGIEEIRLTGGEPTLRKDFLEIACALSSLGLKKLGLTTNGYLINKLIPALLDTNLRHINISLDTLDAGKFKDITGKDLFCEVFTAIFNAKEYGFHVKINSVILKGQTEKELVDFIEFSEKYGIEVRFLEFMKIGPHFEDFKKFFQPVDEVLAIAQRYRQLIPVQVAKDSTSFNFQTPRGGKIGFIASETRPFCDNCSRLRLTAFGKLRPCLFSDEGFDLTNLHVDAYPQQVQDVIAMKPTGRIDHITQPMYQIGG